MTLAKLTKPHPSLPVNPLIAEPLYLIKYRKHRAGTGIDIVEVLTGRCIPKRYRSDLKKKLTAEGFTEAYEKIVRLKMTMSSVGNGFFSLRSSCCVMPLCYQEELGNEENAW